MKKILFFFGTRPEAIKMAPVVHAFKRDKKFKTIVVVSAQHRHMLDQVLKGFGIRSNTDLNIMQSGQSLFDITTRVLQRFEKVLSRIKPDMVMVHGDTTTTLAGALAAFYKQIPVAHVEAGLRTGDKYRPFPEEMNRHLTDSLCSLYFPPTQTAKKNLLKENISPKNITVTGNTVIDALFHTLKSQRDFKDNNIKSIVRSIFEKDHRYILLTAHRRENFGKPFQDVFMAIRKLSQEIPYIHWIYPLHPNPHVQQSAKKYLMHCKNIHLVKPTEYSDMVNLMNHAEIVVTDSGGIQEEAPSLGKPVLVLRDVTERPEAVRAGTVRIVGTESKRIMREVRKLILNNKAYKKMANAVNPYGDGMASARILKSTNKFLGIK